MSTYTSAYAELAVTTNFSFLRGASHPQEMVARADELGLAAIGIADRNSFAGAVRAYEEAKNRKIKLLVGVRLVTTDGFEALAYPTDRAAYGRLCRLLTAGNFEAAKGDCRLSFAAIIAAGAGQIFIAVPPLDSSSSVKTGEGDRALARWKGRLLRRFSCDASEALIATPPSPCFAWSPSPVFTGEDEFISSSPTQARPIASSLHRCPAAPDAPWAESARRQARDLGRSRD